MNQTIFESKVSTLESVSMGALKAILALSLLICFTGCKPATALSSKTPKSSQGAAEPTRSSKSGEINGSDDAFISEDQKAVPPEVITGHYLTCQVQNSAEGDSRVSLGCAAYDSGARVKLPVPSTKWFVAKDLNKSSDTEVSGTDDASGAFDSLLKVERSVIAQNTYIKAVVSAAAAEDVYAIKIANITDRLTVFRTTTIQEEGLENAGFQMAGAGRFELNFKTGKMRVVPAPSLKEPGKITTVVFRLKIASELASEEKTHDFLWDPTGKETVGTMLPGAGGMFWRNVVPTKKGAIPFEVIGYSNCVRCPIKKVTGTVTPPKISPSINDSILTIDFALTGDQIYGIAMDIPVKSL